MLNNLPPGLRISIHAPRVGSDFMPENGADRHEFQSTLPVWGATTAAHSTSGSCSFQSTLPVWGATCSAPWEAVVANEFQSTLPVWGATLSIHNLKII